MRYTRYLTTSRLLAFSVLAALLSWQSRPCRRETFPFYANSWNVMSATSGLLQAISTHNPVEPYVASSWNYMTDKYSKFTIAVWISMILYEVAYFGLSLPGFIAQFLPFMQKFKVQQEKLETSKDQWMCFKWLLFYQLFVHLPMASGLYYYMEMMGIPYEYDQMPHWYTICLKLFGCLVVEDTWHYWLHQLLHHRKLYKHIHKIHHHFRAPFGMVAAYAHPIETAVLGMGIFLGIFLFCNHLVLIWLWMIVRVLETVEVHSGYDFPYLNPLHLIPGYAGTRFHDFHHQNFNGNYASTFLWWDWLFGTDKQYKEFLKSKETSAEKKKS